MMKVGKGYSALKKGRYSQIGFVYHLVMTTKDRQPVFKEFDQARRIVRILKADEDLCFTKTLAFVVMPDHIHWLMQLERGDLAQAVQRIKSLFTKHSGLNVWNTGFYDHAIRSDETLIDVARYIVANPFRAGLCKSVKEYSHWDSVWLE
ncbi:REP-associated tyrosine transposase [Bermanella sp. WJH001]|uniref:REP-associated tyrosine transposase n=1 Tax=Bermanella sp. WJH001 TaxID=3048005 RepID=UPI0024BE7636|nr:transposase [Bermanella sp. WJH001]MDJ1536862.1 transposase [Bermanella sp. WJH001]